MIEELLNLEPTKIKPGLEGKIILLSGAEKCGKTTFCAQLPNSLIIALEPGYNMISGAHVMPCETWAEFKKIVKALKDEKLKEKYKFVCIDTIGLLWTACAKYTYMQKAEPNKEISDFETGVNQISCMPEFTSAIMDIAKSGYGLVMVSHIASKDVPNELGYKYGTSIMSDLNKRPRSFIQGLVDLTITVISEKTDKGETQPMMYLRECIENGVLVSAGGRYSDLPVKAPFSYENLVEIIEEADKKLGASGADMSGTKTAAQSEETNDKSWKEIQDELDKVLKELVEKDSQNAEKIRDIVANYFPDGAKITEATSAQKDLVEAALVDLKELLAA